MSMKYYEDKDVDMKQKTNVLTTKNTWETTSHLGHQMAIIAYKLNNCPTSKNRKKKFYLTKAGQ